MLGPLKRSLRRQATQETRKRQRLDEVALRTRQLCRDPSSGSDGDNEDESVEEVFAEDVHDIVCVNEPALPVDEALQDVELHDEANDEADEDMLLQFNEEDSVMSSDGDNVSTSDSDVVQNGAVVLDDREKQDYVIDSVREWAREPGLLSMSKLDDLLHRLRVVFPLMPLSYKTLFQCQYDFDIVSLQSGDLWYKGIQANLSHLDLGAYLQEMGEIVLDIGMDGVPISKSPPLKFWPILGYLVGSKNRPFIIACYYGSNDPQNSAEYLDKYVNELEVLFRDGFVFEGVTYVVRVRNYILDAPARELVKGCKGHGGYEACEKCTVYGEWIDNRMTYVDIDQPLRTDISFRERHNPEHHRSPYGPSPLERIDTGMVSQFRLDPMHLIFAGCFRQLLRYWVSVPGRWKIHYEISDLISELFLFLKQSAPADFNRKPGRPLKNYSNMKCTELRRILLYDGILAFKNMVDENIYKHFLLLHCAIFIMSSPVLVRTHLPMANEFARTYISHSVRIYGAQFVVYNLHSFCHLSSECEQFGSLDEFAAFMFENELKSIKEKLRPGGKALQQLARRDAEQQKHAVVLKSEPVHAVLSKKHFVQDEIVRGDHFQKLRYGSVTFNLNGRDCYFRTTDGVTVLLKNIVCRGSKIFLVGCRFLRYEDFYTYPVRSSELGIFSVSHLDERRRVYRFRDVECKCWMMPDGDSFLCVPILHTFKCFV